MATFAKILKFITRQSRGKIKLLACQDHSIKMRVYVRILFIGWFLSGSIAAFPQVKVSGIIADSLSFKSIPNVHITVKNKNTGTVADENGFFKISAAPFDTLVFSSIGYRKVTFPVLVNEEDVMILMPEDVTYLRTIIVTGKPIVSPLIREKQTPVYRRPVPQKLMTGSGISFSYFSREQREKRRLQKLIETNERVKAYTAVVSDPSFMEETMKKYSLNKDAYYESIVNFNQTKIDLIAWKSEEEVVEILNNFFCHEHGACK